MAYGFSKYCNLKGIISLRLSIREKMYKGHRVFINIGKEERSREIQNYANLICLIRGEENNALSLLHTN